MWMAILNTSRTVLTTKDNKKDDSYIAKLLLTIRISAAGGIPERPRGVPLHRARALPTIILPSSCGNIYPFSSSLRPRDSSRVQPFPSVFPRLLPPDLGCSARYRLKQSLLSLFPAFCLAKGLHNSLIAFVFCCGWTRATLTVCCDLFVPDLINTNAIRSLCRHATGTFPISLHIISDLYVLLCIVPFLFGCLFWH